MLRRTPSLRILVVDDDTVLIDLIPWLLSVLGHSVETANTGALALQRLAVRPRLDAVLIDLRMPGMDGATLAATIAALPHPPHLVGMSGGEPTIEQAAHFRAFLQKPFGIEGLKQVLDDVLQPATLAPAAADSAVPPSEPSLPEILDTAIYNRLAATMSPAKLQDLYDRTLRYIRQAAPSLDTATSSEHAELAHTLEGSCAMVGAVELATLAQALGNTSIGVPEDRAGSFLESPPSYKILRAAERLERILRQILAV